MNIHNLRIATCVAGICMVSSALPAVWITGVDIGSSVGTSISENTVGAPQQMLFSEGVESPVISSTKVLVSTEVASYDSDFIAFEGGWNERMNSYLDVSVGLRLEVATIDADYSVKTWHSTDGISTLTGSGVVKTSAEAYTPEIFANLGVKITDNLSVRGILSWGRSSMHYDAYDFAGVQENKMTHTMAVVNTKTVSPTDVRLSRVRLGLGLEYAFSHHFSANLSYELLHIADFNLENTVRFVDEGYSIRSRIPVTRLTCQRVSLGVTYAF